MVASTTASFLIQILYISLFASVTYQRKYDIEEDCQKMFRADLKTVLEGFRRSPEYLKILTDQMDDFHMYWKDMQHMITTFYRQNKLVEKIKEKFDDSNDKEEAAAVEITTDVDKTVLRAGKPSGYRVPPLTSYKLIVGVFSDEDNKGRIERLDSKINRTLTVQQRNSMRNLGFEYAGHIIHAMIKNIMGEATQDTQTTQDEKHKKKKTPPTETTTEHVSDHTVTLEEIITKATDIESNTVETEGHATANAAADATATGDTVATTSETKGRG